MPRFHRTLVRVLRITATGLACTLAAACNHEVVAPRMGFVPNSVVLAPDAALPSTSTYRAANFNRAQFDRVVVEPVTMYPAVISDLSEEQSAQLKASLERALLNAFAPSTMLGAGAPVDGRTLVVRAALTEVVLNRPARNISPMTQMRGKGYGFASGELYVVAGTGERVVAAMMSTVNTQRLSLEKLTPLGTADAAFKDWATLLARLADAATP